MKITLYDNKDGTWHVAVATKFGQEDSTVKACDLLQHLQTILASAPSL